MLHDPSCHSLLLITWNKIKLSLSLSINRNFIFFLPTNQPSFPHLTSPLLPNNQPIFPYLILRKLSFLTTLQRLTKDGGVAATRFSIHIAHHPTKDGNMAITRSSIYIAHPFTRNGSMAVTRLSIHIAHPPTRDNSVAVTRLFIHIAYHSLSCVWSSWTLNIAS